MVIKTIYIKDQKILEWVEGRVATGEFRSFSHAVEEGLRVLKRERREGLSF